MAKQNITIIGAGISGLATGAKLSEAGYNVTILEKQESIGGMCASFKYKDFIIDLGPHKIYSQLPGMMAYFRNLLGKDNLVIKKKNSLALLGKYFDFPPQIGQMLKNINLKLILTGTGIGFSFMWAKTKSLIKRSKDRTYEEYLQNGFGKKGYNTIFRDYAWKVWGDPKKLSSEIAKKRMPVPNIIELVKNIIFGVKDKPDVSAEYFYYPKYGIQQIADKLQEKIKKNKGIIITGAAPESIKIKNKKAESVIYKKGKKNYTLKSDYVISTIGINKLPGIIDDKVPQEVKESAKKLKCRSLILVYFILNKKRAMKDNWIFFPEKKFLFNRVSEQKSFSRFTCPKDKTLITAEVTTDKDSNFYKKSNKEIFELVKQDLIKAKILKAGWIDEFIIIKIDNVYPVYTLDYKINLQTMLNYIDTIPNLLSIGRPGMFNYNNMDHTIDMSTRAAEHIEKNRSPKDWKEERKYFDTYRIVD